MANTSIKSMFYGIDGDKIGSVIELHIIENKIDELKYFSAQVESALRDIQSNVLQANGAVIFCAGDSILFQGYFELSWCEAILNQFKIITGRTASMGVGDTATEAYLALKISKARGGGKVTSYSSFKGDRND